MDCFFIDKLGNDGDDDENKKEENTAEIASDEEEGHLETQEIDLPDEFPDGNRFKESKKKRSDFNLEDTYLITNYKKIREEIKDLNVNVAHILEKSTIKPGLEKQNVVLPEKTPRRLKLEKKKLSKKTKGKEWFDMPATQLTKEVVNDFKLLKMRSALDSKHVYKKNDITNMPKYFQVGKVIESAADFYSGRIPKTQRKKTLVEELLADAEFKRYQKKKFKEIMDENRWKKRTKKSRVDNKNNKSKSKMKSKNKSNTT